MNASGQRSSGRRRPAAAGRPDGQDPRAPDGGFELPGTFVPGSRPGGAAAATPLHPESEPTRSGTILIIKYRSVTIWVVWADNVDHYEKEGS
jgi:hypothetical protein